MDNVLLQEDFIQVTFDPGTGILIMQWKGYQNVDRIEKVGLYIIELVREHSVSKILCDNTEVQGPWHDAADWTKDFWFPAIFAAGIQHFAWVWSRNTFAMISARRALPPDNEWIKVFGTYNDALNWLSQVQQA